MKQSCRSLNMFDLGIDLVQARNPHFMTDTITILLRMSICFFWSSFSEFIRRFQPSQSLDTFGYSIYLYLIYNYSTVPCPVLYSFKPYDRCYSLYPIQPCRILTIVYITAVTIVYQPYVKTRQSMVFARSARPWRRLQWKADRCRSQGRHGYDRYDAVAFKYPAW